MTLKLQLALILCILVFFFAIISLLRKNALQLKYSMLWIITGAVLLLLAIFPGIMGAISSLIGIYDVTNGLFAVALFFVLWILLSITSIVSELTKQNKTLSQSVALLENRVREMENARESEKENNTEKCSDEREPQEGELFK